MLNDEMYNRIAKIKITFWEYSDTDDVERGINEKYEMIRKQLLDAEIRSIRPSSFFIDLTVSGKKRGTKYACKGIYTIEVAYNPEVRIKIREIIKGLDFETEVSKYIK